MRSWISEAVVYKLLKNRLNLGQECIYLKQKRRGVYNLDLSLPTACPYLLGEIKENEKKKKKEQQTKLKNYLPP